MTLKEYRLRTEAFRLKSIDRQYFAHWSAFLNFSVRAEKKAGKNKTKPVYRRFEQFFDYEKEINRIKKRDNQKTNMMSKLQGYFNNKEAKEHGR